MKTLRLFYNGKIYSMDGENSRYDAMAVSEDRVLKLGDSQLLEKYPDAEKIDLLGRAVIPGIIDSHAHLYLAADSERDGEMFVPKTIGELLLDLEKKVKNTPKGEWIVYKNTYPLRLSELRFPTMAELDSVAPDHPVAVDGYYATMFNREGASRAEGYGLTILNGVAKNASVGFLNSIAKQSEMDEKYAISRQMKEYNKAGITTVIEGMSFLPKIKIFNSIEDKNLRVFHTVLMTQNVKIEDVLEVRDSVSFLKNTIDGGFLTATSGMEYVYKKAGERFSLGVDDSTWKGNILPNDEVLVNNIRLANEHGFQYTAHCVGSAASRMLINALKKVGDTKGRQHMLLHADFLDRGMLSDMAELEIGVLFQPPWHYMDAPGLEAILPPEEINRFMDYDAILESGVLAAGGSDHMAKLDKNLSQNPYNPFIGLHNMLTKKARDGKVYGTTSVTRYDALKTYTINGAKAVFAEDSLGSLETGKKADFVVLDKDYFTCPVDEIFTICPLEVYFDGKKAE